MYVTACSPEVPPAFKTKVARRDEETEGEIYYKSAVAGFASLMVDTTHEMRCYNATGCEKAALICFLSKPTLVEGVQPIRWALTPGRKTIYNSSICVGDYKPLML